MRVLGMISGTSHDGIDVAVVNFTREGTALLGEVIHTACVPYPDVLRARLIAALPPAQTTVDEVCELDTLIGQCFASAASGVAADVGIDAVCSHGQTIYHWVDGPHALGTLQIGQPAWIAEAVGCPVVSDIRVRDLTVGGQGAPLASLIDFLLLHGSDKVSGALNLGGISNMSVIAGDRLVAFDIGPSNALMDAVVVSQGLNTSGYDQDAAIARTGHMDTVLLNALLADPYYALPAPKSTGKEYFNVAYVRDHVDDLGYSISAPDLLATLAELTVHTVANAVRAYEVTRLVVSGGGVHNPLIMDGLWRELPGVEIIGSDSLGAPADAKEAILMALIGWLTLHGLPGTVPGGTGATQPRILGTITPGRGPLILPRPVGAIDHLTLTIPSESTALTLRPATLDDLDGIVRIFVNCWRQSYRGVLPPPAIAAMDDAEATRLWSRVLTTDLSSVAVAERGGTILGLTRYVTSGPEGTVHSLYVDPSAHGLGVGTRLLDHAMNDFAAHGVTSVYLWVFTANSKARGFYGSRGWVPDGVTRVEAEFGEPELRLHRSLDATSAGGPTRGA